jgi:putative lipoic acid-binding regulatory protein
MRAAFFSTMDQEWLNSFKDKLDEHHAWPSIYIFKFIVPAGKQDEVKKLFPFHDTTEKLSKNGNYVSVTVQLMMTSSDAVVEIYVKASEIEGLIAL